MKSTQKMYVKQRPETIKKLFNSIAARYDLANSINSFYLHALWNKKLVQTLLKGVYADTALQILDVCAGTGDISRRMLHYCQMRKITPPQFHLVDFSSEMLALAKDFCMTFDTQLQKQFSFYEQDVQKLPFDDNSFDIASCAYGIRNVCDPNRCLQELHRVLKPKARLGILELTRPKNWYMRTLHKAYTATMVPLVGKCLVRNREAYSYLSTSIQHFVAPDELQLLLQDCGFVNITISPMHFGIATVILAEKL